MRNSVDAWAARHGVSRAALDDLERQLGLADMLPDLKPSRKTPRSEGAVQNDLRLALAALPTWRAWRNNVGALKDSRGVPVRYGLANDSAAVNEKFKSSDLICGESVTITPEMVGQRIFQHVHIECKKEGWVYTGDERETAQLRWMLMIWLAGGRAYFFNGTEYVNPRNL